jgi:hypothetical protein
MGEEIEFGPLDVHDDDIRIEAGFHVSPGDSRNFDLGVFGLTYLLDR